MEEFKMEDLIQEEAVTEEPAAEEMVAEEPVAEEVVTEDPAAEEAVTEEPAAEEAVAEERIVPEPEAPAVDAKAERKAARKQMRRQFNPLGWSLVFYYVLMNVLVIAVAIMDMAIRLIVSKEMFDPYQIANIVASNGWGYILTALVGCLLLLAWKKKAFLTEHIFRRGEPMTAGNFLCLLCLFMSGQLVFQLVAMLLEFLYNLMGGSIMSAMESASVSVDTVSMLLYMGVVAPITEEILFRGLILRGLRPFGDRFAIVMSAFLFGMFHGNPVQTPYAFAVGLVLGYTALKYNISWAMLLHMINNLVLGYMMEQLTAGLGEIGSAVLLWFVMIAFALAALVIVICRIKEILEHRRQDRINRQYVGAFFTSPGIIAILLLTVLNCALFLFMVV